MRYRSLGRSGVKVSEVSLGTGGQFALLGQEAVGRMVGAALDAGINYFDTANVYPVTETPPSGQLAELYLGAALEGHRHEVVLGTKGMQATGPGPNERGASRYNLTNALEASLRRLRTDHVDLYQIHLFDPTTPMEETMRTLDDMVRSGKVRYVGASQYQAWQLCRCNDLAERFGWESFVSVQVHYNLLERDAEREMLPYCRAMGVGLIPYFAMANGLFGGRVRPGQPAPADSRAAAFERARQYHRRYGTSANLEKLDRLSAFARERGRTLSDLAIARLLTEAAVATVPVGASRVEHVVANARAGDWRLSAEEAALVRAVLEEGTTG
jgi:aryl-alcohol dehydrogenase-like predicted oxidoreductase